MDLLPIEQKKTAIVELGAPCSSSPFGTMFLVSCSQKTMFIEQADKLLYGGALMFLKLDMEIGGFGAVDKKDVAKIDAGEFVVIMHSNDARDSLDPILTLSSR